MFPVSRTGQSSSPQYSVMSLWALPSPTLSMPLCRPNVSPCVLNASALTRTAPLRLPRHNEPPLPSTEMGSCSAQRETRVAQIGQRVPLSARILLSVHSPALVTRMPRPFVIPVRSTWMSPELVRHWLLRAWPAAQRASFAIIHRIKTHTRTIQSCESDTKSVSILS